MNTFSYTAVDSEGLSKSGKIKALSRQQAVNSLRQENFIVTSLKEEKSNTMTDLVNKFRGVPAHDKIVFTRQLSTMIASGLPINQALRILGNQADNDYFGTVILDVAQQIDGGSSFSESLEAYEQIFGRLYLSLVRAGEASGNLDNILSRLADTMEADDDFNSKVRGAMIYPLIIVLVMVGVLAIMFLFVIPRLAELYEELDAELPFMTRVLVGFSEFMVSFWWVIILLGVGGYYLIRKLSEQPEIELQLNQLQLKAPVFGPLLTEVQLTSFTRTLSMLVSSGIPLLEALDISKETLTNRVYKDAAEETSAMVEKGKPLAEAFKYHEEFPALLGEMVAVGEQTGKVDEVLLKISAYFETQATRKTDNLASAIEPIVMVVLGVLVGFLVISLILPIYSLTSQI